MKKLSNTVTELKKKTVAYKKVCIEIKENIGPEWVKIKHFIFYISYLMCKLKSTPLMSQGIFYKGRARLRYE